MARKKVIKKKRNHATAPLKPEDAAKLLLVESKRDRLFFGMGLFTAYRIGEIRILNWGQLFTKPHFKKEEIDGNFYDKYKLRVRKSIVLDVTKNGKQKKFRTVAISPKLKEIIEWAYEGQDLDHPIFLGKRGAKELKPMSDTGINKMLKQYFIELDIDTKNASSHCLRKTWAMSMYRLISEKKTPADAVLYVMRMIGHSDVESTLRYIGVEAEEFGELYDELDY